MKTLVWSVVVLAACGHKAPDPVRHSPVDSSRPPPNAENATNIALQCDLDRPKANFCDPFNHPLSVEGDRVHDCYRQLNADNNNDPSDDTYDFLLDLRSSSDPSDTVRLALDNFSGPKTYNLDGPGRFLEISSSERVERCVEDQRTEMTSAAITARTPGRDSSCDSAGCTVQISVPDPTKPNRHTLRVDCPDLCEDQSYFVCKPPGGGRVQFQVTHDCPIRP